MGKANPGKERSLESDVAGRVNSSAQRGNRLGKL